jgi:hypothetical protein
MNKNAQVTMFIIVGLIILLGAIIGYVAFENELIFKPPEDQVTAELETQLRPFTNVVAECQERILEEGTKKLLKTGGYLDTAGLFSTILPLGNSVSVGEQIIPYWHYIDDGISATERPQLQSDNSQSMNSQLANYVDQRLIDCMPWSNFVEYDITYQQPESEISFSQQQTTIVTSWPVQVQTLAGQKSYDQFTATINAPVRHLYEVADEQITQMSQARMPETNVLRMLSIYATGSGNIPPLYGTIGFLDSYKLWTLEPARQDVGEVVSRTTDFMQVYGSEDMKILTGEDQVVTTLQLDNMALSSYDVSDTRIDYFKAPGDVYYTVDDNPAVAIPEYMDQIPLIGGFLPPLAETNFDHDITFPILLSVSQDEYELIVAYEGNIRDGEPQRGPEDEEEQAESLCSAAGGSNVQFSVERQDEIELDSPVDIIYTCGALTCPIGSTTSSLEAQLPTCVGGTIEAYHDSLFSESMQLTSQAGEEQEINLRLYEPKQTSILLLGREIVQTEEDYILAETETPVSADVIFIRQGSPYVVQARAGDSVDLVPGTYDILAIEVLDFDPEFIIPEEEFCAQDECVTINETRFDSLPVNYLDLEGVQIDTVPQTITLIGTRLTTRSVDNQIEIPGLESFKDFGYLSALFELQPENPIRFE